MVHNAAKSDFSPWKNYAQILLGATNRCLKNKKVMENCQHASSQDEPHLTSHSFLGWDDWLCDAGRAAEFWIYEGFQQGLPQDP